jgi:hypothetical protein
MTRVLIIGGGRFGRISAEAMLGRFPGEEVEVVDEDERALAALADLPVQRVRADGVDYAVDHLTAPGRPDWVIPCVPLHLAHAWLLRRLPGAEPASIPEAAARRLPHPLPDGQGGWLISHADFTCPDDCPEPADICTHTGRPRPASLFRAIPDLWDGNQPVFVLRSRQLAPGVGGLKTEDLFDLLGVLQGRQGPAAVATACRCHGMVSGLRLA